MSELCCVWRVCCVCLCLCFLCLCLYLFLCVCFVFVELDILDSRMMSFAARWPNVRVPECPEKGPFGPPVRSASLKKVLGPPDWLSLASASVLPCRLNLQLQVGAF